MGSTGWNGFAGAQPGSVDTASVQDGAITRAKLGPDVLSALTMQAALVATTETLPACTATDVNTLTADASGVFPDLDDQTVSVGARIVVQFEADPITNGVYELTDAGSVGTPWVLSRSSDLRAGAETYGGAQIYVQTGTVYGDHFRQVSADGVIVVGTDAISFGEGGGVTLFGGTPAPLGVAGPGTSGEVARGDHVHAMPSASDVGADVAGAAADAQAAAIAAAASDATTKADAAQAAAIAASDPWGAAANAVAAIPADGAAGTPSLRTLGTGATQALPGNTSLYADPLTTDGDLLVRSGGVTTRLAKGNTGDVLTQGATNQSWAAPASQLPSGTGRVIVTAGAGSALSLPTITPDTLANRPAASATYAGATYYATDVQSAYQCVQTGASTYAWAVVPSPGTPVVYRYGTQTAGDTAWTEWGFAADSSRFKHDINASKLRAYVTSGTNAGSEWSATAYNGWKWPIPSTWDWTTHGVRVRFRIATFTTGQGNYQGSVLASAFINGASNTYNDMYWRDAPAAGPAYGVAQNYQTSQTVNGNYKSPDSVFQYDGNDWIDAMMSRRGMQLSYGRGTGGTTPPVSWISFPLWPLRYEMKSNPTHLLFFAELNAANASQFNLELDHMSIVRGDVPIVW